MRGEHELEKDERLDAQMVRRVVLQRLIHTRDQCCHVVRQATRQRRDQLPHAMQRRDARLDRLLTQLPTRRLHDARDLLQQHRGG